MPAIPNCRAKLDDVVQKHRRSKNLRSDSHLHAIFEPEFRKKIRAEQP